jgi:putative spermidine/putrescine transport system substrate-binding protein
MRKSTTTFAALAAALSLLAACGDDGGEAKPTSAPTNAPKPTDAPKPADTTPPTPAPTTPAPTTPATPAPTTPATEPPPDPGGAMEGEVNIIAWAGYVENGSTDPAVDWVTGFEEETKCKVNVKVGNSSDEMVELMQSGEYDGVSASGDATLRLINGGDVAEVDLSKIPNYADVFAGLKDKPWNSVGGKSYGVPHGRGANLLVYNTEAFTTAPDSIKVMFEGGSAAEGKVSVYDAPIYIADAAIYLMATKPELKITNPYALDADQFAAAVEVLKAQKANVGQYWALYTDQQAALESGEVLAGTTWQVIVNLASANGAKIAAVKHKEGATGWSDTWMISSKAKHPNCMYAWMNHIISPDANAQVAEWFGEAPSNAKSCALTAVKDHCAIFHAEDEDYWKDVYYWATPVDDTCLDGRTDVKCIPYSEWVTAWSEIRS